MRVTSNRRTHGFTVHLGTTSPVIGETARVEDVLEFVVCWGNRPTKLSTLDADLVKRITKIVRKGLTNQ